MRFITFHVHMAIAFITLSDLFYITFCIKVIRYLTLCSDLISKLAYLENETRFPIDLSRKSFWVDYQIIISEN